MFLYFFVLFLFINSLSNFIFWVLLECNMVLFIVLCFFLNSSLLKMEMFDFALMYFILQSLSSVVFLMSSCFNFSFFLGSSLSVLVLSLCFKSAIFPFFFWLLNSINSLNFITLSFILSFQKVPIYIFLFNLSSSVLMVVVLGSLLAGGLYLTNSRSWFELIFFSSLYSCFWIMGLYMLGFSLFLIFFLFYTFFLLNFSFLYSTKFFHKSMDFVTYSILFIMLLGLPPLSMFFFKFYFFNMAFQYFSLFFWLILWLFTFVSLIGYFNFMYSFFLPSEGLYGGFKLTGLKVFNILLMASLFFWVLFF